MHSAECRVCMRGNRPRTAANTWCNGRETAATDGQQRHLHSTTTVADATRSKLDGFLNGRVCEGASIA